MTHGGYGGGQADDPFGPDPFGGPPSAVGPAPPITHASSDPGFSAPNLPRGRRPRGEVNTLATLSIVFAFVFAPAGAALGHLSLKQIRERAEQGRERALIGLTLSYVIIVLALIALLVWLLVSTGSEPSPAPTPTTTAKTTPAASPPPPRTTVITPPPQRRPTVAVEDLRVGDCVEVQQTQPDPTRGDDTNIINIFPVACEVRDGVFRVDQVLSTSACSGQTLFNRQETVFACISNYRG